MKNYLQIEGNYSIRQRNRNEQERMTYLLSMQKLLKIPSQTISTQINNNFDNNFNDSHFIG